MSKNAPGRTSLGKYQNLTRELIALLVKMAKLLATKRHPNSQIRHGILIHSMLRAARTGDAQLLLSEGLYSEEMHCVNRALAEISINAAYLQIADEAEIDSYLRYDKLATARVVQKMNTSMPKPHRLDLSEELHVRQLLDQPLNDSWSSKSASLRAREVDKDCRVDLMTTTALFVYNAGHAHVHGTASSVATVGDWMLGGADRKDQERLDGTAAALNGTALCLLSLCVFAGQRYRLGLDSEIMRLQETMNAVGLD
jgi:hypothetical protein